MPHLVVSKNDKVHIKIPLSRESLSIGRSPKNDLTLPDDGISRHHAKIIFTDGGYCIQDLDSRGGTLVNGDKISTSQLTGQCQIGIGGWTLLFEEKSQEEAVCEEETAITRQAASSQTQILKLDPVSETVASQKTFIQITDPQGLSKKISLVKNRYVLGSSEGCDVVIKDDYVSSQHCEILFSPSRVLIKDLSSTNGTFVNGLRVVEAALTPSSEVKLGESKLTVLYEEIEEKIRPLEEDHFLGLVGKTEVMRTLFAKIRLVAPSENTVLIQAPTGSGKEMVAHLLHELSQRNKRPYVILNCGAISANLIESELFGHEKGAFTGALGRRTGAFEEADHGTLFLDEVGELPLELQPKLLRVLENKTIKRVGGDSDLPVNVRIIAATNRNLALEVKNGKFREDLFFRLFVIPLMIPALKDRRDDIPLLANHFIRQSSPHPLKKVSKKAMDKLINYSWPGNVRELKNVIFRSLIFCSGAELTPEHIELFSEPTPETNSPPLNLADHEKEQIIQTLRITNGNRAKAAEILGIAKSTLFKKLKDYNIS